MIILVPPLPLNKGIRVRDLVFYKASLCLLGLAVELEKQNQDGLKKKTLLEL